MNLRPLEYTVRRSARRTKSTRIELTSDGSVVVTAPDSVSEEWIRGLVEKRAAWIEAQRAQLQRITPPPLLERRAVLYRGEQLALTVRSVIGLGASTVALTVAGIEVRFDAAIFHGAESLAVRGALIAWYRERAEAEIKAALAAWSPRMGLTSRSVTIGEWRSKWGSCSPGGDLKFNWKLILADPELLEYVVVHELAHTKRTDHSPAYWAMVEAVMPDHRERRRRLNEIGPTLTV